MLTELPEGLFSLTTIDVPEEEFCNSSPQLPILVFMKIALSSAKSMQKRRFPEIRRQRTPKIDGVEIFCMLFSFRTLWEFLAVQFLKIIYLYGR